MRQKFAFLAAFTALLAGCSHNMTYPTSPRGNTSDSYGEVKVADPYRWLEEIDSPETATWVKQQNEVTNKTLEAIPARAEFKKRLTELWNYERFGVPFNEGGRWFYTRNDGLQDQSVLYTMKTLGETAVVLLDPNTLSEDGKLALNALSISPNGHYLAYAVSSGGSDWQTWKIRDIRTGKDLDDSVPWSKFSGANWAHDSSGFYYGGFDEPKGENLLKAANTFQKVYFHRLGQKTPPNLIFDQPDKPGQSANISVSDDGAYLIRTIGMGTDERNMLHVQSTVEKPDTWLKLVDQFEDTYNVIGNVGSTFYLHTTLNSPKYQVIAVDLNKPAKSDWRTVIAENDSTLQGVSLVGNSLIANYLSDAKSVVKRFDLTGKLIAEIALPGVGTANGFGGKASSTETFYSFGSFTQPNEIFRLDLRNNQTTSFKKPTLALDTGVFETVQVFYPSKDGTKIPMFITQKKGQPKSADTPVLLYGYGGFNIPVVPSFSPAVIAWVEQGGIWAVANLRGGGEYGEVWHEAGTKLKKQNVFDDFAAAADFLIAEGMTSKKKIAINGRSNGGLLVAATMLQRPELFGAAIPAVGVLDMLRFNEFTIGKAWESDYGSPQNPDEFKALYAYSPLHNVRAGIDYPPTLVLTGDHDDRVYPAHSFKFIAQLQHAYKGKSPQLIRIETRGGHGAGKPTSMVIDEFADWLAFSSFYLGTK